MKITLVRVQSMTVVNAYTTPICPPLGMAYIASVLRKAGFDIEVIDAVGEQVFNVYPMQPNTPFLLRGMPVSELVARVDPKTSILGFSCMFSEEWPQVRETIKKVKKRLPDAMVMAGGEHITSMPEYVLNDCAEIDYCVLGEGEETAVELCNFLANEGDQSDISEISGIFYRENGEIKNTLPRKRLLKIDDVPRPAWDLFPIENYLKNGLGFGVNRGRMMPLLATRGCPYQCTFCSSPVMWTTRWLARSPQLVFSEMMDYVKKYDARSFDFYDLTAIIKKAWIVEFANLIIDSGEEIAWQLPTGTRCEAIDFEVANLLYRSGCKNITYAPESGSVSELKRIKKKIKLDRMLKSMRDAVVNKLNIKANIIIGMPGQTMREVLETMRFIVQMAVVGIHDMSVNIYSCYPGSEMFTQLQQQGKVPKKITDSYLLNLSYYTDLTRATSYSDHLSNRTLIIVRPVGLLLFYSVSFLLRPHRLFRFFTNQLSGKQESRLEMALSDLFKRKFQAIKFKKASS